MELVATLSIMNLQLDSVADSVFVALARFL